MAKREDLTGKHFGRLVVEKFDHLDSTGHSFWLCKCQCGNKRVVRGEHLIGGHTKSCKCLQKEKARATCIKKFGLEVGEGAFKYLYRQREWGAKKKGHKWKISLEDAKKLFTSPCHYCGSLPIRICRGITSKNGGISNGEFIYNGIDRKDNNEGYTLENSVSCCWRCNSAKHATDYEEFKEWVKKVYKHFILG